MRLISKVDELPQILTTERALVFLFHSWSHVSIVNSKSTSKAATRLVRPGFESSWLDELFQIEVSDARSELTEVCGCGTSLIAFSWRGWNRSGSSEDH